MSFNPDHMNSVRAFSTIQTAYAAVSAAQTAPPGEQIMSFAVLFHEVCLQMRLDPSEMLDKARRLVRHSEDHYSQEIHALREYIKQELK